MLADSIQIQENPSSNDDVIDKEYVEAAIATAQQTTNSYADDAAQAAATTATQDATAAANSYTDTQLAQATDSIAQAAAAAADQYTDTKISQAATTIGEAANAYADEAASAAITSANSYTDTKATQAVSSANSYTDTKTSQAVTSAASAANSYTDAQITAAKAMIKGLDMKDAVRVAATSNITLSGLQTIDGVTVVDGDRILLTAQTSAIENGIWIAHSGTWARSDDAVNGEISSGAFLVSVEGTANSHQGWLLTTSDPITVGQTTMAFVKYPNNSTVVQHYDPSSMKAGKPAASEVLMDFVTTRAYALDVNLLGSQLVSTAAATATATFTVKKVTAAGVTTTITTGAIAAGGKTVTWANCSAPSFAIGDRLQFIAPSTQDATLSDLAWSFKGTES